MPRREDIEKFKEVLNSLGGEPEIMSKRAQPIEEVPPPQGAELPGERAARPAAAEAQPSAGEDLGLDILDLPEMEPTGQAQEAAREAPAEAPSALDGLESLEAPEGLGGLESLEVPAEGAAAAESSAEPALSEPSREEGLDAGLDFSSLFGEEAPAAPIREIETPSETPAAEEEFQIPEGEEPALQADLLQMEVLPEEPAPGPAGPEMLGAKTPPAEREGGAGEAGAGPFEDLGSLDLGALVAPEAAEAGGEAPAESVSAPSEEDLAGIELPNLEDMSLAEPSPSEGVSEGVSEGAVEGPAPPEAPSAQPPLEAFPEAPLEGLSLEGPGAAGPEAAEMPSLEGLDLGAGLEAPGEPAAFEIPGSEEPGAGAPGAGVPGVEGAEAEAPGAAEMPRETPSEVPPAPAGEGFEGLEDLGLDQLPEAPEGFGGAEGAPPAEEAPRPARPGPARPPRPAPKEPAEEAALPELAGAEGEISLTPEQFARLRSTLESLPRNLKIIAQDVVADGRAAGADLANLVSLLVSGASAQEIANIVGKITGKRIRIPAGYEKRTGVAFEAERRTFAYAFRENIWPLVRVFVLTAAVALAIAFLGYRYVYRPLYAISNYRIGVTHILGDRYVLANQSFDRAAAAWPIKRWYQIYAERFADKRQYILAEQKFDQLLARWPADKGATLAYARMESAKLADYPKADALLKTILEKNEFDYDALLAAGDNNLEWAAIDKTRFEPARQDYATLIDRYGARDELLFRMMRYFVRTDNPQEIDRLRRYFDSRPGLRVDPDVYAELGGYLIDHRRLDYVKEILFKADQAQTSLPEIHYNLARYYRLVDKPQDELLALTATLARIKPTDALTQKRLTMEIDTHTRLGELHDARQEYIDGEKELQAAIALVEENQRNKLIGTGRIFGRPYADLGDLNYYIIGDLAAARGLYQKAVANSYRDSGLPYKIGYTEYAAQDYADALQSFMETEDQWGQPRDPDAPPPLVASDAPELDYAGKPPVNLLFAIGNTFYQRGDLFAAQGYYLRLRDRLETRRAALGPLDPAENPQHRSLLETLVKVYNNLGVATYRLAARTGDRTKRSEGLVYITNAAQIADTLSRTPGRRSTDVARNLPFVNQRAILYPVSGIVPQISADIPRDLRTLSW